MQRIVPPAVAPAGLPQVAQQAWGKRPALTSRAAHSSNDSPNSRWPPGSAYSPLPCDPFLQRLSRQAAGGAASDKRLLRVCSSGACCWASKGAHLLPTKHFVVPVWKMSTPTPTSGRRASAAMEDRQHSNGRHAQGSTVCDPLSSQPRISAPGFQVAGYKQSRCGDAAATARGKAGEQPVESTLQCGCYSMQTLLLYVHKATRLAWSVQNKGSDAKIGQQHRSCLPMASSSEYELSALATLQRQLRNLPPRQHKSRCQNLNADIQCPAFRHIH
jgi:hypothetical protein